MSRCGQCGKDHRGHGHRRRNRALRKERDPIQWFNTDKARKELWGQERMVIGGYERLSSKKQRKQEAAEKSRKKDDGRVKIYAASVLGELQQKAFPPAKPSKAQKVWDVLKRPFTQRAHSA